MFTEVTENIKILRRPTASNEINIETVMKITGDFSRAQNLAT